MRFVVKYVVFSDCLEKWVAPKVQRNDDERNVPVFMGNWGVFRLAGGVLL